MKRVGLVLVALVSCGDGVLIGAGAGAGGEGGADSTSSASHGASTSAMMASTSATTSSTSSGTGGEGGRAALPLPRLMTVQSYDGMPEAGVHVVGHAADGEVIDHELTAPDGTATVLAPDDGMITVGYEIVRIFPDGNGGSAVMSFRQLHTLATVGAHTELSHRMTRSRVLTENPPMNLEITSAIPSADQVLAFAMCADGPEVVAPVGTTTLEIRGCPGEPTFDMVVVASTSGTSMGHKIVPGIPHQPGQTVALSIAETDLEPESADHVFSAPAMAVGLGPQGDTRSWSTEFPGLTSQFSTPLSNGVSAWLVAEYHSTTSRLRLLPTIPASTSWAAPTLLTPSAPTVSTLPPQRPQLSWSFQGNGTSGDAVEAIWFDSSSTTPAAWSMLLSAGTTSATYPALPAATHALIPGNGLGRGFSLYTTTADSIGAGIVDLFAFAREDRTHVPSPFVAYP